MKGFGKSKPEAPKKVVKAEAPKEEVKEEVVVDSYIPSPDDVVVDGKVYRKVNKKNPETNSEYSELELVK